jgi:hypothetical protein
MGNDGSQSMIWHSNVCYESLTYPEETYTTDIFVKMVLVKVRHCYIKICTTSTAPRRKKLLPWNLIILVLKKTDFTVHT